MHKATQHSEEPTQFSPKADSSTEIIFNILAEQNAYILNEFSSLKTSLKGSFNQLANGIQENFNQLGSGIQDNFDYQLNEKKNKDEIIIDSLSIIKEKVNRLENILPSKADHSTSPPQQQPTPTEPSTKQTSQSQSQQSSCPTDSKRGPKSSNFHSPTQPQLKLG